MPDLERLRAPGGRRRTALFAIRAEGLLGFIVYGVACAFPAMFVALGVAVGLDVAI